MFDSNKLYNYPFENDSQALDNLKEWGIKYDKGLIELKQDTYPIHVLDAVDYLCDEWDYAVKWI